MSPWSYRRPVHPTWLFLAMLKRRSFKLCKRNYHVALTFLFQRGGEMSCECKTFPSALQLSLFPHLFVPIYLSHLLLHSLYFSSEVIYSTVHLLRAARISHERELSFLRYSFGFHIIIQKGPDKPVTCKVLLHAVFSKDIWNQILNTSSLGAYEKNIFCYWVWDGGRDISENEEDAALA